MIFSRISWGIWALVPVAAVTYHFGPGQTAYVVDRAARQQNQANETQSEAQLDQDVAYSKHLAAIDARRQAFLDPTTANQQAALDATGSEESAYTKAAFTWKATSDRFQDVLTTLGDASPKEARDIRWAKARADVRAGEIWTGIDELESLVTELDDFPKLDDALARAAREELATAYYYGARLLRLSGMPVQEWRIESGKARQHFRYLAERELAKSADNDDATAAAKNYQQNLELVLNLEQSSLAELQGKPLPKDSPHAGKPGNRPGKRPGKGKGPPNKDGRGAGGPQEIRDGW